MDMDKVFLVLENDYGDLSFDMAFTRREDAEEFMNTLWDDRKKLILENRAKDSLRSLDDPVNTFEIHEVDFYG